MPGADAKRPRLALIEARRPNGKLHGVYVTELAELAKAITLCWACRQKFDHKKYHYFYERNLRVAANCDACRTFDLASHFFIHESLLTPNKPVGGTWTPRRGR